MTTSTVPRRGTRVQSSNLTLELGSWIQHQGHQSWGLVNVSGPPHSSLHTPSRRFCLSAGVGGNLVAVQASRISTFLHMNGMPGENSEQAPRRCPSPCTTFFSPGNGRVPAS